MREGECAELTVLWEVVTGNTADDTCVNEDMPVDCLPNEADSSVSV